MPRLTTPDMNFGDIYLHSEREYVFLAKTKDSWFVGNLLSKEESKHFEKLLLGAIKRNKGEEKKTTYFHIKLRTKELEERILLLCSPEREPLSKGLKMSEVALTRGDLLEVKKAILSEGAPVPPALIEEMKEFIKRVPHLKEDK